MICQVTEAAGGTGCMGGTGNAQLIGEAERAASHLAHTSFKTEAVHSLCNIFLQDNQNEILLFCMCICLFKNH